VSAGLTLLIRSLALMTPIKNLGRHNFNSADTCSIACISAGVSGCHSSKILSCGSGAVDVLASAEP
jgi:hypothetical protein